MGSALMRGMLAKGSLSPKDVVVYDTDAAKTERMADELGIAAADSARTLTRQSDIIALAVKPDIAAGVLRDIHGELTDDKTLLSVVLGLGIDEMSRLTGGQCKLIRCMPNTPALVGEGMICIAFGEGFNSGEKDLVANLFASCGLVEIMEERYIERVTALTGSSPAYVFVMLEAMADAAVRGGLPRNTARRLAAQAVLGSAKMALVSDEHTASLKDNVCSPGGSTIEAVRVLESGGFRSSLIEAMIACDKKAAQMINH
jgi:pyrroline-5-carboxylate reductase